MSQIKCDISVRSFRTNSGFSSKCFNALLRYEFPIFLIFDRKTAISAK